MSTHLVAPSILAADFSRLKEEVEWINTSQADWIHCDIMDGRFVPNLSFGLPVLAAIHQHSQKPLDVHLMIEEPERYVADFRQAGAQVLTVHAEATRHLDRLLHQIRDNGMQAGVALNPATPLDHLRHVLYTTDLVCLMSVNPGFGGQQFIPQALHKCRNLAQMRLESGYNFRIEMDGGVTNSNAQEVLAAGADVLVAGSYVFKQADPAAAVAGLKGLSPHLRTA